MGCYVDRLGVFDRPFKESIDAPREEPAGPKIGLAIFIPTFIRARLRDGMRICRKRRLQTVNIVGANTSEESTFCFSPRFAT